VEKKKAVGIKYGSSDIKVPILNAKGIGEVAEKIIKIAEENDVPVYQDTDLIELLMVLELNQQIPAELYKAVAEVLAFVYKLNKKESV